MLKDRSLIDRVSFSITTTGTFKTGSVKKNVKWSKKICFKCFTRNNLLCLKFDTYREIFGEIAVLDTTVKNGIFRTTTAFDINPSVV